MLYSNDSSSYFSENNLSNSNCACENALAGIHGIWSLRVMCSCVGLAVSGSVYKCRDKGLVSKETVCCVDRKVKPKIHFEPQGQ